MKAMLILIWTLLVTFIVSALVSSGPTAPPPSYFMLVVAIGFLVWSSLAPVFLRAPVRWIYELFNQHVPNKTQDLHLTQFERRVIYVCLFASICGSMSIAFLGFWPAVILSPIIPCMALAKSYGGLQTKYFDWL